MLERDDASGGEVLPGRGDYRVELVVVRRIKNHDVERCGVEVAEGAANACADNNIAVRRYPAVGEVLLDQRLRAAVARDEGDMRGPAARRLDPDRAGPGVAIEDARAGRSRREDVEQRLAQLVRRRPQSPPRRRLEAAAFVRSSDHAHGCCPEHETTKSRSRTKNLFSCGLRLEACG